jgi:hypothetical protein
LASFRNLSVRFRSFSASLKNFKSSFRNLSGRSGTYQPASEATTSPRATSLVLIYSRNSSNSFNRNFACTGQHISPK